MNVLHVVRRPSALTLAQILSEIAHLPSECACTLFDCASPDDAPMALQTGVHRQVVAATSYIRAEATDLIAMLTSARQAAPDVLHAHGLEAGAIAQWLARELAAPFTLRLQAGEIMESPRSTLPNRHIVRNSHVLADPACVAVLSYGLGIETLVEAGLAPEKAVRCPPPFGDLNHANDANTAHGRAPAGTDAVAASASCDSSPESGVVVMCDSESGTQLTDAAQLLRMLSPERPITLFWAGENDMRLAHRANAAAGNRARILGPDSLGCPQAVWPNHGYLVLPGPARDDWFVPALEAATFGVQVCARMPERWVCEGLPRNTNFYASLEELIGFVHAGAHVGLDIASQVEELHIRSHVSRLAGVWRDALEAG